MRTAVAVVLAGILAACTGMSPRPTGESTVAGNWYGYVVRNGTREPVTVELAENSSAWDGRLTTGDDARSLESVRVSGNNVHFELPGEGVFDGAAAEDTMAGSVSGPSSGSFSLTRTDQNWTPYPAGP